MNTDNNALGKLHEQQRNALERSLGKILKGADNTVRKVRQQKENSMRKVTKSVVGAFNQKQAKASGNTATDGKVLLLCGNRIAEWRQDGLYITDAGWPTVTTKARLNGIVGVRVSKRANVLYLNGFQWDGSWKKVG